MTKWKPVSVHFWTRQKSVGDIIQKIRKSALDKIQRWQEIGDEMKTIENVKNNKKIEKREKNRK